MSNVARGGQYPGLKGIGDVGAVPPPEGRGIGGRATSVL
jgi:hypothetical protein